MLGSCQSVVSVSIVCASGLAACTSKLRSVLSRCVNVGDIKVETGEVVVLAGEDNEEAELPPLGLVQALWQTAVGAKEMQVRCQCSHACPVPLLPLPVNVPQPSVTQQLSPCRHPYTCSWPDDNRSCI